MTLRKLLLAVAGGVAVLGSFLPWASVTFFVSIRANAFQMGEPLPIILAILALLCSAALICLNVLKEKQIKNIIKLKNLDKMPLYLGVALVAIAVIAFIYVTSNRANASFGIWMIGLAGVVTIVLPQCDKIAVFYSRFLERPMFFLFINLLLNYLFDLLSYSVVNEHLRDLRSLGGH